MSNGVDLLRLLEPAVRPVATPSGAGRVGDTPFESQGFDELLRAAASPDEPTAGARGLFVDDAFQPEASTGRDAEMGGTSRPPNLLDALSDVGRIENTSLRTLIVRTAAAASA